MAKELTFNFGTDIAAGNSTNQNRYTAQLVDVSKQRATEALRAATTNPALYEQANAVLDGATKDQVFNFLVATVGDNIATDCTFMGNATDNEFSSMLESRRSEMSHTKKKVSRTATMTNVVKYIAAAYAELLIRQAWNKPYAAADAADFDEADLDAINAKIRSLQSKKSRTNQLIRAGATQLQAEYDEVVAEIERLQAFRPTTKTSGKIAIKDADDVKVLRDALSKIDMSTLSDDEVARLATLMEKLG